MLRVHVASAAVAGPGLAGWEKACAVLSGTVPYQPAEMTHAAPGALPATERRRSSKSTRLAVQVAREASAGVLSADTMAVVFASANGDGEIADQICASLAAQPPMVSPIRFHNSVHNAPAGYWSIATGARTPSTSLAGFDATFAAALLSASAQVIAERTPVLLVVYDLPFPEPLNAKRPMSSAFATALLLTGTPTAAGLGSLEIRFEAGDARATPMSDPALEALRGDNPAARALPLLAALVQGTPARIVLEHGARRRVIVGVQP